MTEMLRYRWTSFGPMLDEDGPFVTYADHVEALRQATALATPETVVQANYWYEEGQRDGYEQAKRVYMAAGEAGVALAASDALAAAVQRVEALPEYALRDTCIAAIKGDQP